MKEKNKYSYYYVMGHVLDYEYRDDCTTTKILKWARHSPVIVRAKNWEDLEKRVKKWVSRKFPKSRDVSDLQAQTGEKNYYSGVAAQLFTNRSCVFAVPDTSITHLPQELATRKEFEFKDL